MSILGMSKNRMLVPQIIGSFFLNFSTQFRTQLQHRTQMNYSKYYTKQTQTTTKTTTPELDSSVENFFSNSKPSTYEKLMPSENNNGTHDFVYLRHCLPIASVCDDQKTRNGYFSRVGPKNNGSSTQSNMKSPEKEMSRRGSTGSNSSSDDETLFKTEICKYWSQGLVIMPSQLMIRFVDLERSVFLPMDYLKSEKKRGNRFLIHFRHKKYKTSYCKKFQTNGTCPYGKRCSFIHEQLSVAPPTDSVCPTLDERLQCFPMFGDNDMISEWFGITEKFKK
jgi:hypothetical protein